MQSLHSYLCKALARGFRELSRSLKGLSEEDAGRGADPGWRRYRHGAGLDGSIAGIVRHVAGWKHAVAAALESGACPPVESLSPPEPDWPGLLEWLESG